MTALRKLTRPSRRSFLIGAGATAGLLIGYTVWPRDRALNLVDEVYEG